VTSKVMAKPSVMGVVNVTPDSFSDGGQFLSVPAAVDHGLRLLDEGADRLDIGGESTRPGAELLSAQAEMDRVLPVIEALRQSTACPISIDTLKADVARAAVRAGATIWNDVTALRGSGDAASVAAELGVPVVLMHMQGEPGTMQVAPHYEDVVAEVCAFLSERAAAAMAAGVAREAISLDPGIGFGKNLAHNLTLLAHLDQIMALGFPVLLGVSRKRFVQALDPTATEPTDRLGGSLAAALAGARAGVDVIRVHDVRETVQALKVWQAIEAARS
jgi:dihydropteroate synthase